MPNDSDWEDVSPNQGTSSSSSAATSESDWADVSPPQASAAQQAIDQKVAGRVGVPQGQIPEQALTTPFQRGVGAVVSTPYNLARFITGQGIDPQAGQKVAEMGQAALLGGAKSLVDLGAGVAELPGQAMKYLGPGAFAGASSSVRDASKAAGQAYIDYIQQGRKDLEQDTGLTDAGTQDVVAQHPNIYASAYSVAPFAGEAGALASRGAGAIAKLADTGIPSAENALQRMMLSGKSSTDHLATAIRPIKTFKDFEGKSQLAMDEIASAKVAKGEALPTTLADHVIASREARPRVMDEVNTLLQQSGKDSKISMEPAYNKIMAMSKSEALAEFKPELVGELQDFARKFVSPQTPEEIAAGMEPKFKEYEPRLAEKLLQRYNSELSPFFGKKNPQARQFQSDDVNKAMLVVRDHLGDSINNLLGKTGGDRGAVLKKTYGALRATEDQATTRLQQLANAAPQDVVDRLVNVSSVGDIAEAAIKAKLDPVGTAAGLIRGSAKYFQNKFLKGLNNADVNTNIAYQKWAESAKGINQAAAPKLNLPLAPMPLAYKTAIQQPDEAMQPQ